MKQLIKIDSLKLTFPRNAVQIIDGKFAEEYKKIYVKTGEIDEEHINLDKHKIEKIKGISSRIGLGVWQMGAHQNEVLFIQVNAKMLRERYFEGITWDNWTMIYDHIINQGVIYIDQRAFLNGLISDIDFAFDAFSPPKEFIDFITAVYARILPERHKFVSKPFRTATNVGIMLNKREKATPSRPFAKFYHKGLELQYKSEEFARSFLQGQDYENIARLEVTLKNSRDKKYHGLNNLKDMKDLLDMDQKKRQKVVFSAVPKYLHRLDKIQYSDELSPQDKYLCWCLQLLAERGYGKSAFYAGLEIFDNKQQRHRMKKKLEKIIDGIPDQELINKNSRIDDLFQQFKIF